MGLLKNIFSSHTVHAGVTQLPSGSIAVDRAGHIVNSTVSSAYPVEVLQTIGKEVLALLHEAEWKLSAKTDADAQCEFTYQPDGWEKAFRFVALRYEQPPQPADEVSNISCSPPASTPIACS